ncbi:MAG: uncharacterized protein KVP18_004444, partial [Porospora cf. gigantea A]
MLSERNGDLKGLAENAFVCGDYETGRPPKTRREQAIMGLMMGIRCKPDWATKVFDEAITTKWREEAQRQDLTEIEIQYAIDECQWWAKQALKEAQISAVEGVFLADNVVSDDLRLKLSSGLKRLENVPNDQKDWHPR